MTHRLSSSFLGSVAGFARGGVSLAPSPQSTATPNTVNPRESSVSFLSARNRTERRGIRRLSILHADNPPPVLCAVTAAEGAALAALIAAGVA